MNSIYRKLKRTTRQAIQIARAYPAYRHWTNEFAEDPLFSLSTIDRGLGPRTTSSTRTVEERMDVARRIISAYRLAKADQTRQRDVYKVSNEWVSLFQKPLRPLLDALDKGDAAVLCDLLDNFFRSEISQGLIGLAADMTGMFFERTPSRYMRTQLLIDSLYRYRLLQRLYPEVKPEDLHIEDFGNPYGMYVTDHFVRTGVDYQYYYARQVAGLLDGESGKKTVVELGGGIGGFAYFLNKAIPSGITYINLDLPEILCISTYQLLNLFPNRRVLLYGEAAHIDSSSIAQYDMALLPSFLVESLAENSVDVSFNSYSLAEMDLPTIQNYASHLSRITRTAILHVNHVSQALVGADRFSFDAAKFSLVNRSRALWNLGRNLKCDEYEFLLTRRVP